MSESHDNGADLTGPIPAPPPAVLDWDGSDDPDCPYNWPLKKRVYMTSIPVLLSFASSIYTSGAQDVSARFGVSHTVSLLGLSLFLWALGLGAIVAAPVSEHYGRRVVYQATVPVFGLFILGSGLAQNFATLAACRALAGFFGAAVVSVGGGTNADLWPPARAGRVYPLYFVSPFIGPALGPVVGGFVVQATDFRWLEWVVLFMVAFNCVYALPQPETYKRTILQARAERLKATAASTSPAPSAARKFALPSSALVQRIVLKPFRMLFVESIILFMTFYMAFNFAVFYSFFAAFPYVFGGTYGFSLGMQGLTFLPIFLGCIIGFVAVVWIDRRTYPGLEKRFGAGRVPPEYRLYGAIAGSVLNPVSLFWFGWTAHYRVHWLCPVVAAVPFAIGNIMVYSSGALYIMNAYGSLHGASALSANSLLRYAFGGAFPMFTVQMFQALGIGWASSLLGFVSVVLVPVPWVLYRYGPRIRAHSQYIGDSVQPSSDAQENENKIALEEQRKADGEEAPSEHGSVASIH